MHALYVITLLLAPTLPISTQYRISRQDMKLQLSANTTKAHWRSNKQNNQDLKKKLVKILCALCVITPLLAPMALISTQAGKTV